MFGNDFLLLTSLGKLPFPIILCCGILTIDYQLVIASPYLLLCWRTACYCKVLCWRKVPAMSASFLEHPLVSNSALDPINPPLQDRINTDSLIFVLKVAIRSNFLLEITRCLQLDVCPYVLFPASFPLGLYSCSLKEVEIVADIQQFTPSFQSLAHSWRRVERGSSLGAQNRHWISLQSLFAQILEWVLENGSSIYQNLSPLQ